MGMYARVSTLTAAPGPVDRARQALETETIPGMASQPGYVGLIALADPATGKTIVASLWESEDAMRASDELANRLRASGAARAGATAPPTVDRMQVVLLSGVEIPSRA